MFKWEQKWEYAAHGSLCVLTTGAASEAVVMVEATHSLAGLIGSMHCLITLHTRPWNRTQARRHTFNQHGCHGSGKFMLLQHKILISNIKTKRLFHQFLEREKRKLQEAGLDWKGKHISICLFDLAWRLRSLLIKELIRIRAVLLLQHTQLMCPDIKTWECS